MSAKLYHPDPSLPAVAWLTRVIESDARNLKNPSGGARLAQYPEEVFLPSTIQTYPKGMASLYRRLRWPSEPRQGEDPTWPDAQEPLSFPGPD